MRWCRCAKPEHAQHYTQPVSDACHLQSSSHGGQWTDGQAGRGVGGTYWHTSCKLLEVVQGKSRRDGVTLINKCLQHLAGILLHQIHLIAIRKALHRGALASDSPADEPAHVRMGRCTADGADIRLHGHPHHVSCFARKPPVMPRQGIIICAPPARRAKAAALHLSAAP
eukprot:COSAG06_NODE_23015_length_705_cov_0.978548_1_plen_169_part_00